MKETKQFCWSCEIAWCVHSLDWHNSWPLRVKLLLVIELLKWITDIFFMRLSISRKNSYLFLFLFLFLFTVLLFFMDFCCTYVDKSEWRKFGLHVSIEIYLFDFKMKRGMITVIRTYFTCPLFFFFFLYFFIMFKKKKLSKYLFCWWPLPLLFSLF